LRALMIADSLPARNGSGGGFHNKKRSEKDQANNRIVSFTGVFAMKSITILVSDMADLIRIHARPLRGTPPSGQSLHRRLVLLAGQPGRPSKLVRVRANQPSASPGKVAAALQRLVPSIDGGVQALVLPVGGNRVVAVDAAGSRGYLAELECFDEEAAGRDLLTDPALYFLEWLHWWREWAASGYLKEPVMAATLKALQAVGRYQRWRDADFRVTGRELEH
jgi:hypothetical protein